MGYINKCMSHSDERIATATATSLQEFLMSSGLWVRVDRHGMNVIDDNSW